MNYSDYLILRNDILAWVQPRIKPARFVHTLGVEQQAVSLARRYLPEDSISASLAALLHDNAKSLPTDVQLDLCSRFYPEQQLTEEYLPILHAFAGAAEARIRYPELSEDIIRAVAFHTTGRPDMSTLEKIIYCADYSEPNRTPFPGLDEARKLLMTDLDKGLAFILNQTAGYIDGKGKKVHFLTLETIRYYEAVKGKAEQSNG